MVTQIRITLGKENQFLLNGLNKTLSNSTIKDHLKLIAFIGIKTVIESVHSNSNF